MEEKVGLLAPCTTTRAQQWSVRRRTCARTRHPTIATATAARGSSQGAEGAACTVAKPRRPRGAHTDGSHLRAIREEGRATGRSTAQGLGTTYGSPFPVARVGGKCILQGFSLDKAFTRAGRPGLREGPRGALHPHVAAEEGEARTRGAWAQPPMERGHSPPCRTGRAGPVCRSVGILASLQGHQCPCRSTLFYFTRAC